MFNNKDFNNSFDRSERRFFSAFILTALFGLIATIAVIAGIIYIVQMILQKV